MNPSNKHSYTSQDRLNDILDKINSDDKVLFIPLAWNFFSEIRFKILNRRTNQNDLFLKYFPKVEVYNV